MYYIDFVCTNILNWLKRGIINFRIKFKTELKEFNQFVINYSNPMGTGLNSARIRTLSHLGRDIFI